MKILIDADGCLVADITVKAARKRGIECVIICDTYHTIQREGTETITVDKGADSADLRLVNLVSAGDIVIFSYLNRSENSPLYQVVNSFVPPLKYMFKIPVAFVGVKFSRHQHSGTLCHCCVLLYGTLLILVIDHKHGQKYHDQEARYHQQRYPH